MYMYMGVEVWLPSFLTSALDVVGGPLYPMQELLLFIVLEDALVPQHVGDGGEEKHPILCQECIPVAV
jgi:hypothetical protein